MTLLKTLTALLLLANLAFGVWVQGGLLPGLPPPGASEREPERLRLQVRPESVIVLSPQAASAAMAPAVPPTSDGTLPGEANEPPGPANGTVAPTPNAGPPETTRPVGTDQRPGSPGERSQPSR